jgi:hypothetical protein
MGLCVVAVKFAQDMNEYNKCSCVEPTVVFRCELSMQLRRRRVEAIFCRCCGGSCEMDWFDEFSLSLSHQFAYERRIHCGRNIPDFPDFAFIPKSVYCKMMVVFQLEKLPCSEFHCQGWIDVMYGNVGGGDGNLQLQRMHYSELQSRCME